MNHPAIPIMLLMLAAPAAIAADPGDPGAMVGQMSFHQRIIIRIPRLPVGRRPMPNDVPLQWVEKGSPKCLKLDRVEGATITQTDSVDLVLDDGKRMRAMLDESCPALDFYSGFYIKPGDDGTVCAGRDEIHSRAGASCPIRSFKRLVARR